MEYVSKNNLAIITIGIFFLYLTYKSDNTKLVKVNALPSIKKSPVKDDKKEDKKEESKKEDKKEDKKEESKKEKRKDDEKKKSPKKDDVPYISSKSDE